MEKVVEIVYSQPFFFFLIFVGPFCPFRGGHWYPCFGLLVMSALGFKARVDSLACVLFSPVHNRFLRFTSGATPAFSTNMGVHCISMYMSCKRSRQEKRLPIVRKLQHVSTRDTGPLRLWIAKFSSCPRKAAAVHGLLTDTTRPNLFKNKQQRLCIKLKQKQYLEKSRTPNELRYKPLEVTTSRDQ